MIPQRNISLITNSLVTDNRPRLPESVIERDYVLAWFLSGLSNHPLREKLAFKGGTALRRCWFDGYRFSEDLDFTLIEPLAIEDVMAGFGDIHDAVKTASGVHVEFDKKDSWEGRNNYTFYLQYQGPLPANNSVKVDITLTEQICFPLQERPILRQYELFNDLPEGAAILSYSLDEIMVEKIVALSDRARNEPRDLYDLWYLLNHYDSELADITPELEAKLAFRQRTTEDVMQNVVGKEDRLRRLWSHRLSEQVSDLPPYDSVYRDVKRALRAAGLYLHQDPQRRCRLE